MIGSFLGRDGRPDRLAVGRVVDDSEARTWQRTTRGGGPGRPWKVLVDAPSLARQEVLIRDVPQD